MLDTPERIVTLIFSLLFGSLVIVGLVVGVTKFIEELFKDL